MLKTKILKNNIMKNKMLISTTMNKKETFKLTWKFMMIIINTLIKAMCKMESKRHLLFQIKSMHLMKLKEKT